MTPCLPEKKVSFVDQRALVEEVSDGLVRWGYATARFCSREEALAMRLEASELEMRPSAVLAGPQKRLRERARGDEIAWIHGLDGPPGLAGASEKLRKLGVRLGEALAEKRRRGVRSPGQVAAVLARAEGRRGDVSLLADKGTASRPPAMVSRYRAGRGGFRPHVDAAPQNDLVLGSRPDPRVVTAVLYLHDMPKDRGGTLRLWRPGLEAAHRQHHSDLSCLEIPPSAGMLVVFWSAVVLHEVKPVLAGDRFALSMWFNEPPAFLGSNTHFGGFDEKDEDLDDDHDDENTGHHDENTHHHDAATRPRMRSDDRNPTRASSVGGEGTAGATSSSAAAVSEAVASNAEIMDLDDDVPPPPPSTPESQISKHHHPNSLVGTASAPPPSNRKVPLLATTTTTTTTTSATTTPRDQQHQSSKRQRQTPPFPVFEAE